MKNISIKEIAKIAGVGIATVSRVINENPDVKDETRQKVLKVIEEYNYVPNNSARNLKRTKSKNIGILTKGIYNPFFSKIIDEIGIRIQNEGYIMVLQNNLKEDSEDIDVALEFIKEKRLEGIICLGGNFDTLSKEKISQVNTPIVLASLSIEEHLKDDYFSSVTIENDVSAYNATNYLCHLKHKKIGLISSDDTKENVAKLRQRGYKKALEDSGLNYDEKLIQYGNYSFESGEKAMEKLLKDNEDITAIFAISDIMAIGAIRYLLSNGYKVPEDISVFGFDGIEYGKYSYPSITTIEQPTSEIGKKSADILFGIIVNNKRHRHELIKTKILIRESCIEK